VLPRRLAPLILSSLAAACSSAPPTPASPSPGAETAEVLRLERAMWEAWKRRDLDTIRRLTAPDYRTVSEAGPEKAGGFDDVIRSFPKFHIRDYHLGEMVPQVVAPGVVVVMYGARIEGTYGDEDISREVAEASVWVRRDGRFLNVTLHEITLPARK